LNVHGRHAQNSNVLPSSRAGRLPPSRRARRLLRLTIVSTVLLVVATGWAADPSVVVDLATVSTSDGVLRRVHGFDGNGAFGVPVAGGFDCDDDGFVDYAMASMLADPLGRQNAGEVYLVFGDGTVAGTVDTAVAQAGVLRIAGDGTDEVTGSEIWMDDVTGDGVGDLLLARQNHRPDAARPGAGALTILVGGSGLRTHAAGLTAVDLRAPPAALALTTIVGVSAVDRLGIWVRTGDVTGDGTADIVVGADQEDLAADLDNGAAYVIRGGPHLATTQTIDLAAFGTTALAGDLMRITPPVASVEHHFGATCQIADLDGNGRGEVLVASALNRAGAVLEADGAPGGAAHGIGGTADGTLYIAWDDNFTGDPWPAGYTFDITSPPGTNTIIDGGFLNANFGEEIVGGLDYDDDGTPDLFVGDITGDLSGSRLNAGAGHLLFDAASLKGLSFGVDALPPGTMMTTFLGGAAGYISSDTALHGDFDGDGIDDIAFSAPHARPFSRFNAGALYVFFGQAGPWPVLVDLMDGALPEPTALRIAVVAGARGNDGADVGDTLAYSAAAGDVDGDGRDDLITNEMQGNGVAPAAEDVGNLIVVSGALFAEIAPSCAATPDPACRVVPPGKSNVRIGDLPGDDSDRLTWRWSNGDSTSLDDFLDPVTRSAVAFHLCVYDGSGAGEQPLVDARVAGAGLCGGRPCWKATASGGLKFKDASGGQGGVRRIKVRVTPTGRTRLQVKARGGEFTSPELPLVLPATAQLVVDDGESFSCWQAGYAGAVINDASLFKAKTP